MLDCSQHNAHKERLFSFDRPMAIHRKGGGWEEGSGAESVYF